MTAHTVNIIISAEIAERKVELGRTAIPIDDSLDEHIYQGMRSAGKTLHQVLLQEVDDGIQEVVPETWKNVGRDERQITTCVGTVQFKRRVYRDEAGKRQKPLDKILGIEKGSRYSQSVLQKGSYLASELPYREAADMLGWLIGDYISHSAIGRMVRKVGESYQAEEEAQREQLFEKAEEIEPGRVPAKVLYGESDGVWICLQREGKRKTEVRVGILYTGKKAIAKGRNRLENKVVVTKIVKNSQEWQETMLKTAYTQYDLSNTKQMMVGGDGSRWVRQSFDMIGLPTEFVLDRYHLYREARRAFGFTRQTENWIRNICQEGPEAVMPEMRQAMSQASPKAVKRMHKFLQYLINNRDGLLDPDCRAHLKTQVNNLGAIEGNVDKLVVRRLKGRGRSWRIEGAKAMLAVCCHKKALKQNAFMPFHMPEKIERKKNLTKHVRDDGEWLQAGVPSLHECHANRPWAKVLKHIIHPKGVL
jgi:ribonucleotide reductase beta subunit family protein with ferritin-like domain